ncbi:transcription-repair coupling factor [Buchananella hordeovulneris]|uniref:Transcription-repair-coupling factor n=1 Tax=Buchananella hordeovulneris TaxID=52770 RepID=A0A1Q5PZ17_9ACTO|nr:transcription-repair coupling factor [Buchananella hordeovulneris]OKL52702.1 transcription-repair coupling factor [Buchananella hordeovulneris]
MRLSGLTPLLASDPAVAAPRAALHSPEDRTFSVPLALRGALLAELAAPTDGAAGRPLVVLTATSREAEDLAAVLADYLPAAWADQIALFPAWETLPHERLSPRSDTMARRSAVARRLAHPQSGPLAGPIRVLLAPIRAAAAPIVAGLGEREPLQLQVGQSCDLAAAVTQLAQTGYRRVDMVERRGEFAVRGGILDVFVPTDAHPVRVEFFGDEVEEIRSFTVADQRTFAPAPHGVWAPVCREIPLDAAVRQRAAALAGQLPGAADLLAQIADGLAPEGMESLLPVLVDKLDNLLDLVAPDALVLLHEPERIRTRLESLLATSEEFLVAAWSSAAAGGSAPLDLRGGSFLPLPQIRARAQARALPCWQVTSLPSLPQADNPVGDAHPAAGGTDTPAAAQDLPPYRGNIPALFADVKRWLADGQRVVVTTQGPGMARRVVEQFTAAALPATLAEQLTAAPAPASLTVTTAAQLHGLTSPAAGVVLIGEADITGRAAREQARDRAVPARRKNAVDPLQLQAGDYVVHEVHGVGRFVELISRTVGHGTKAGKREYLVIEYAPSKRGQPGDRLFVPTDSLDQVTKYVGGDAPALSRMGGADWAKTKNKARAAVKDIAKELLRIYAARQATKGHAFSPDTPWQLELEQSFAHVETPDQLATMDEIKADMEREVPMDRLLCGDVGYGKTELAVRAAFKAVQDGKQVAVLVPTTLLVSQHLETFTQRYANFPVTVKALSRFQSDKEAQAVKDGTRDGSVDVVIGTHRLLTGEVRFKDLGLVIIDEEQRFGVEHKETLKALRANVDVLAMSATPIPRTLEMAVTGIREMSTLATPPEERHPVLTYVGAYEERQVAAAIRRELLRDGQVFFIHNRVQSIMDTAAKLTRLVPEARIAVAHGQMSEQQLERVIVDFWNHEFDVLVCTTIVETGLDISNANTLIVDQASKMGLSQLHQLRGRVGRSRERAYAYFLYPASPALTETAYERLRTIAAHTDLGAGMQVAMKDLEIRGAGNLLGGEQSGHIAGVGFDLYVRMVADAVAEYRGERERPEADVRIDLPVDAHVPESYVSHDRLRLEIYTKISAASDETALEAVREELVDRYGPVPVQVERLLVLARLRAAARALGLAELVVQAKHLRLAPLEVPDSLQLRLRRLYPGSAVKPAIRAVNVPLPRPRALGTTAVDDDELLAWVGQVLADIQQP